MLYQVLLAKTPRYSFKSAFCFNKNVIETWTLGTGKAAGSSAKDYVESLHQNSTATLLYGKNNVRVQPVSAKHFFYRFIYSHLWCVLRFIKFGPRIGSLLFLRGRTNNTNEHLKLRSYVPEFWVVYSIYVIVRNRFGLWFFGTQSHSQNDMLLYCWPIFLIKLFVLYQHKFSYKIHRNLSEKSLP